MKQGDILLISYQMDLMCWLIRKGTNSKHSHVAWVLNKNECISAHGTGVRTDKIKSLRNWLFYKVKVIRLPKLTYNQIRKVSRILKKQQYKYNYFKFVGNFFYLLFTGKRKFNVPTCALLIASALEKARYTIKKTNQKYIVPEDFNKHKFIEEIEF